VATDTQTQERPRVSDQLRPGGADPSAVPQGGPPRGTAVPLDGVEAHFAEAAGLVKGLGKLLMLSPLVLAAGLLAGLGWWYEHDAHLRQAGELQELKKQTQTEVTKLQADADAATRDANQQRAQQILALQAQRDKLAKDAATLEQQIALLRGRERSQVEQIASLPAPVLAGQVASQLGLGPEDLGTVDGGASAGAIRAPGSTPQSPSPAPSGGTGAATTGLAGSTPTYRLSEQGLRKIDTALVQLDSCQKQVAVRDQEATNCQQQTGAASAIISQQKGALDKLNAALADKDQILAREEQSHKEELKIVRGTWTQRVVRVAEHVAIGVAIGVALKH